MSIKYADVYMARESLNRLADMSFDAKVQMKVTRLVRWGISIAEDLDTVRQKLVDVYAARDEDGEYIIDKNSERQGIRLENPVAFSEELAALMDMEVEDFDDSKHRLTLEELHSARGDERLTVREEAQLGKLLEGYEEVASRSAALLEKLGHKEDSEDE